MPNDVHKYLIDVDVLARIHVRRDSATTYDALIRMAEIEKLQTVRQTFDELKMFGPQFAILKDHRDKFQVPTEMQFDERVANIIELLGTDAPYLWEQTGGKTLTQPIRGL